MPLTVVAVVAAVSVSYLRGGRITRIGEAELRWSWLLVPGLALQLAVDGDQINLSAEAATAMLLTSQALVLLWVVGNWWRPGMPLIVLGLLLNAAVITANGAMPVDPEAIRALGVNGVESVELQAGKHELMDGDTALPWLADIFPVPPIRTIISPGDALLAAGLLPLVHHLMTYRTAAERRGGHRQPQWQHTTVSG